MKTNEIWIYLHASMLGFISLMLPTFFLLNLKQYDFPLFPLVRTVIEGVSMWTYILLFLSGFGVKLLSKLSRWKIGLTTMVLFPIMANFDLFVDLSSYNLFPTELFLYAVYYSLPIIGAYLAQGNKKILTKNQFIYSGFILCGSETNQKIRRKPAHNSNYTKVAVQWLNDALYLFHSSCLVKSG